MIFIFFFFNDTATTEIYTLSLHDALPIWIAARPGRRSLWSGILGQDHTRFACGGRDPEEGRHRRLCRCRARARSRLCRSEEHTSELQSQSNLVCRLLLEKKKKQEYKTQHH